MTGSRSDPATRLAGSVAGAGALDPDGRAALAALSIVNGNRPEFSLGGSSARSGAIGGDADRWVDDLAIAAGIFVCAAS